jgi:ABC-2 type transport system permease protein
MEIIYYLGVFAKAEWVQLRNDFRKHPAMGWGLVAAAVFLPIGAVAGVRLAQGLTAAAMRSSFAELLPEVPGGLVLVILLTALLNGTASALQSIFLASDLEPLLATPAPMRAIFLVRLLRSLAVQLSLTVAVGTALLAGYGLALGYGLAYFVALPLLLALIAFLPTGLGAILALLLIRVAPAGFTRDFVNVVNILLGLSGFAIVQLLPRVSGEAMSLLSALNSPWLPSTWAGQALIAIGEGRWADALPPSLAVAGLSLAMFGGSLLLTEQQAANGIAEMATTRGGRRRPAGRVTVAGATSPRGERPRSVALVVFRKELRTYLRDTTNLQPLLYSLLVGGSWVWGSLQVGQGMFAGIGTSVLAALAIATMVAQHPGLSAISREGPGLWQLQSAPVSGADVALGKLALAYLPYLVLGVPFVLVVGVVTRLDPAGLGVSALIVGVLGWGCAALLTNLAFRFPRLDWQTPNQQVRTAAWFVSIPCLGLYVLIGVPLLLVHRGVPPGPGQLVTLLVTTGVVGLATWLIYRETLHTASRRLATIEP